MKPKKSFFQEMDMDLILNYSLASNHVSGKGSGLPTAFYRGWGKPAIGKWISRMRLENKVIALSTLFGLLTFLVCEEIYMRTVMMIIFISFGFLLSRVLAKLQQAQGALAERTVQLERVNKELAFQNAELDEFTYIASHDLQEPLRVLTTFSELLHKDLGNSLPERVAEDLDFIIAGGKRMQRLIQDLLSLSRAGRAAMKREKASLAECADRALEALAVRVRETRAEIIQDELPNVWGDETLLTQLYQNLIGNALKFTAEQHPIIHLTAQERDGDLIFGVKDNGIGIAPKYAQQIFKPFMRLHGQSSYEGSGIGLAICHKIVERHGGKIWVESEPGKGAHFQFTINNRRRTGNPL